MGMYARMLLLQTYNVEVAFVNKSTEASAPDTPNNDTCFDVGRELCDADPNCAAFGVHPHHGIQLHGCLDLVTDRY